MLRDVIPQSPTAHCYICSSTDIDKVCHRCGRAICVKHQGEPVFHNSEYIRLLLNGTLLKPRNVVYCRDCARATRDNHVFWRRVGQFVSMQRIYDKDRCPVPVVPTVSAVTIQEQIHGSIALDASGDYQDSVDEMLQGKLETTLHFSATDRERIKAYHRKHRAALLEDQEFYAGFVVMQKTSNVSFDPSLNVRRLSINTPVSQEETEKHPPPDTYILRGRIGDQPYLSNTSDQKRDQTWKPILQYSISRLDGKDIPLPVQLVPILVRDNAVALVLQARPGIDKLTEIESVRIDKLTVEAPQYLSKVNRIHPPAVISHGTRVTWSQVPLVSQNETDDIKSKTGQRSNKWPSSRILYIRFQNNILADDTADHTSPQLTGKLEMTIKGTLSGLGNAMFFYPWGQKLDDGEIAKKTKKEINVEVDFSLNLSSLRCSNSYAGAQDGKLPQSHSVQTSIDHRMITRLSQRLDEANAYVKRIVENPVHTEKNNAYITNHCWDLVGRHYRRLYPVDFHLIITGQQDRSQDNANRVTVELDVHGFVTDAQMIGWVDDTRDELIDVVCEFLKEQ